MKLQPRQQILEIWNALGRQSFTDKAWEFGEGEPSSVSDAEQLLCVLYPATEIPALRLDEPDETQEDVLNALSDLGDSVEIPRRVINTLMDFMERHTGADEAPSFSAGNYLSSADGAVPMEPEQRELGVVDAYSLSVTLSLATLGFLKIFTRNIRRADLRERAAKLETATSVRLSAAMAGLLRSFTVSTFDADSEQGRTLCSMINQTGAPNRLIVQQLRDRLKPVRATIRDFTLGLSATGDLENDNLLFECGWSWGVVKDAPPVDTDSRIGEQPAGVAMSAPYLYFTVVALDGIADLFSDRTLTLGLLDEQQQRLAQALRLRWEVTQQYWSALARFDDEAWPLEDIPWRTSDRQESAYFSLLVASILVQDLQRRRANDDDLTRTVAVMEELALRSRTTRRMAEEDDSALALHAPGVQLTLLGSETLGPLLKWTVADFSAQLLKRSLQLSRLSRNTGSHDRLVRLSERIMDHLWQRRIAGGPGALLWDDIGAVYPNAGAGAGALSWSLTERVIECLVTAFGMIKETPIRSPQLISIATDLLSEADHLLDKELMELGGGFPAVRSTLQQAEVQLQRARRIVRDRPGTACALALQVLSALDELVAARRAAGWRP